RDAGAVGGAPRAAAGAEGREARGEARGPRQRPPRRRPSPRPLIPPYLVRGVPARGRRARRRLAEQRPGSFGRGVEGELRLAELLGDLVRPPLLPGGPEALELRAHRRVGEPVAVRAAELLPEALLHQVRHAEGARVVRRVEG